MITVGISKWQTESGYEVGKRSLEMKLPPDFVQVIGPCLYPDENEGITCIPIYKYDKSKPGEASEAIANSYMVFFGVPGFRCSTNSSSGAAATKKMMGLE
jgi:hypothetical protein